MKVICDKSLGKRYCKCVHSEPHEGDDSCHLPCNQGRNPVTCIPVNEVENKEKEVKYE